ncbi:metallophosphoesterase family protein [Dysgonomonas termitidis]|uniref:Metallophosphoesterase family protein n=1 Tax=Dysgonomonas termitidis TaxID=1516126 RepID=A0ABV9KXU6_9BACT
MDFNVKYDLSIKYKNMPLRLLHFSDIHFYNYKDARWDKDREIQNEIIQDLSRVLKDDSTQINHILICGDIAFSGKDEEYEDASQWINNVCLKTGCENQNIFLIPGNHDVNRSQISLACNELRSVLREQNIEKYDDLLEKAWLRKEDKDVLLLPFIPYYKFVKKYQIEHDHICCDRILDIDGVYKLKIRGINSALLSYIPELDDDPNHDMAKLCIGEIQALISTHEENVIHLSMCHHPIQWLKDGETIKKLLDSRASIQLFGHEHNAKTECKENILKIYSGAMQPSRSEHPYEPVYNIIDISIENEKMKVAINSRRWSIDTRTFEEAEKVIYELEPDLRKSIINNRKQSQNIKKTDESKVWYEYFSMKNPLEQLQIGKELNVTSNEDELLPMLDRVDLIYKRLREQNRLVELLTLIGTKYAGK